MGYEKMININKKQQNEYWEEILYPLTTNKILVKGEDVLDARKAKANKADGGAVNGILILTNMRLLFVLGPQEEELEGTRTLISLKLDEIEEATLKRNERQKGKLQLILFYKEMVFSFEDIIAFGMHNWVETIKESKNVVDNK